MGLMMDPLILTMVFPLLAAGGVSLASYFFVRLDVKRGYVRALVGASLIAVGAAVALLLSVGDEIGSRLVLPSLTASLLTESAVGVRWNATLWPLGLSFSVVVFSLLLAAGGRGGLSFRLASVLLLLLSAGLAVVWSASPFTTMVCWAFYDVAQTLGWLAIGGRRGQAVRVLVLGTIATLLLWLGALVSGGGIGTVQWALIPPGGVKMSYWTLAGLLRLGVYPLHLSVPRHIDSHSPLAGAMLLSPLLGWGLWSRLALASDRALLLGPWAVVLALLTVAGGGILAWTAGSPKESRPWISVGANGSVLLATVLLSLWGGGEGMGREAIVPLMTLGAAGWMLGTGLLFSGGGLALSQLLRPKTLPQAIPSIIGALSLIGAPVTLGFVGHTSLMRGLVTGARWGWIVLFSLGHVLLVAAVTRWLLGDDSAKWSDKALGHKAAWGVGLAGLAGLLMAVGVVPSLLTPGVDVAFPATFRALVALPPSLGWLLWGGTVVLGVGLARLGLSLRPRISLWLNAIHDVLLFDWAYALLVGALERGFSLLSIVDDVLGGRGALLWSCILMLILILVVGG